MASTSASERLEIFNGMSPEEKARIVRKHIALWLETHQHELSAEQIEIVRTHMALVRPQLYVTPRPQQLLDELHELEARAAALLSRDQIRDALTMHW